MATTHDRRLEDWSNCPIARTLEVVGEKWTLLVLREALYGVRRFDDFRQILGCASNILTARLALLVEHEVLCVQHYQEPGQRSRPEYALTAKGADLMPVLAALQQWGERYRPDPKGPVVIPTHRECGNRIGVNLLCSEGHHIGAAADVELRRGPGAKRRRKTRIKS